MQLSQKIKFPEDLKPVYHFLQNELNRILSDEELRRRIKGIDRKLYKSNYWKELRKAIGEETQYTWKNLPNKAWFFLMIAEQIRQLCKSQKEQIELWTALKLFDNNDNEEFYEYCQNKNIKFSRTKIKNLKNCKEEPDLPKQARLSMDFAFIDKQAGRYDENIPGLFHYKPQLNEDGNKNNEWSQIQIYLHPSTRALPGARITKPKFFCKDGIYEGVIAYTLNEVKNEDKNIAVVDLGRVNLFTLSVIKPNGEYSKDYYKESVSLSKLKDKVTTLYNEKEKLINKNKIVDKLFMRSSYIPEQNIEKWIRREKEAKEISNKIVNLKKNISGEMAKEISQLSKEKECGSIFVEDLSWLASTGGKWNHSEQQERIKITAEAENIEVYKFNCKNSSLEHPITGELGKERGREIVWSDGLRMDRDRVATLNGGQRRGKKKVLKNGIRKTVYKEGYKILKIRDKDCPTPKQVKRKSNRRKRQEEIISKIIERQKSRQKSELIENNILGVSQIVVTSPGTSSTTISGSSTAWFSTFFKVRRVSDGEIDYLSHNNSFLLKRTR